MRRKYDIPFIPSQGTNKIIITSSATIKYLHESGHFFH